MNIATTLAAALSIFTAIALLAVGQVLAQRRDNHRYGLR